ncbi:hypothetical protein AC578_6680 [Pseudocercospora eumusae]|uniref:Uncharacterized protein n=1 Tax=Pseudocercospora eumusae TaxID=321146 RepID=A0A139HI21_9PEZI|nr:hypothetical protein AC578_6680 [Pseudocercospora eumusae]
MGFLDKFTNLYHDDGELDLVDEEAWFAERAPQLPVQSADEKDDDELDQYLLESEDESDAVVGEEDDGDDLGALLLAEFEINAEDDFGLDRLSDAGMAQAVRSNALSRAYSNREKRAFLRGKTGQSQYRLRKEALEAAIRTWYHHVYEPCMAANRSYEERKAKRRAKLAARKASDCNQSTVEINGKTVIVLDDTDEDDDSAPPALSEEEHERVRQALRGPFGKNGWKTFSQLLQCSWCSSCLSGVTSYRMSRISASPVVASKPKQKRKQKQVVAVDAITDVGERAELQRAQMAMFDAARAGLNVRA